MDNTHINIETREGQRQLKALERRPIPQSDDLTRPYWEAATRHELRIQRCTSCKRYQHPPQAACRACASKNFEWAKVSGKGVVYTFTIDHEHLVPGFTEPFVLALVVPQEAQDDTVRITCNIRDCALNDVRIGMPVRVTFEDLAPGITLPQFRPAS